MTPKPNPYALVHFYLDIVNVDDSDRVLPACHVSNFTLDELRNYLCRQWEVPPNLLISVKSQKGEEIWPARDRPVFEWSVDLCSVPSFRKVTPRYFIKVAIGRQPQPHLKCAIPIVHSKTYSLL
jgi:hypothetical protein